MQQYFQKFEKSIVYVRMWVWPMCLSE